VLGYCKQFPNVAQLLQILGTLPITTAEAKRVFSTPVTLIAQPPNESLILQPVCNFIPKHVLGSTSSHTAINQVGSQNTKTYFDKYVSQLVN